MRIPCLFLISVLSLGATSASAGALISSQISTTISGAAVTLNGAGSGFLDAGTGAFTYDASGAFSGLFTDPAPVTSMGGPATAAAGAALITSITLNLGNGPDGLIGNTGTTGSVGANGLTGSGGVFGFIGGLGIGGVQLAAVQLSFGGNATFVQPPFKVTVFTGLVTLLTLSVTQVAGDFWHLGTVTATGLTTTSLSIMSVMSMSSTGGTAMANGGVSVTGGGNTVITLVTLAKTRISTTSGSGTTMSTTATPVFLTLTYVPEPGTLLLLGSGAAGLFALGRRRC